MNKIQVSADSLTKNVKKGLETFSRLAFLFFEN